MTAIQNATITGVSLGHERGILTAWLQLDYGDSHQGFGGYALHNHAQWVETNRESWCGHFVNRCLEITGVRYWEELPNKSIRAHIVDDVVIGIGHITKELWFYPRQEFLKHRSRFDLTV